MTQKLQELLIVPSPSPKDSLGSKGILSTGVAGPIKLRVETLKDNLAGFIVALNELIANIPNINEPFKLEEIQLVLEVNAEGSLQLVGGVKVGASGGITLKLKR